MIKRGRLKIYRPDQWRRENEILNTAPCYCVAFHFHNKQHKARN